MAIIADKMYNLKDYATQFGENSQELAVAEVLTQTNDILNDLPIVESNLDSGHEYAVRTGIPAGTWRRAYEGVQPEKATTKVEIARPGTLGAYSVVEAMIAEKGGNKDAVRGGQARAIVQGMSETIADALFYGGKAEMAKCVGFAAHYNTLNPKKADTAKNVIDGGGDASGNTSIYLVVWDMDKVFGFFPKGTKAGIKRVDYGLTNHLDPVKQAEYPAYKEYFEQKIGLCVQDWRYAGRIANLKVADLASADLLGMMQDLEEKVQSLSVGKPVWYMNRTVKAALRKQLGKKANVFYTPDQPTAKSVMFVDEVPVHVCDALSINEAKVEA